jgi:hypothetical protein
MPYGEDDEDLTPEELQAISQYNWGLTDKGRVWLDEIERRFVEGQDINDICKELNLKPWMIQLLSSISLQEEQNAED